MRKLTAGSSALRRTAKEVKRYRIIMRVMPIALGLLVMVVSLAFIISILYNKYGSFTVTVDKFDSVRYSLTLSETPDFRSMTSRLNSKASENITNINKDDLPKNLDMINGEHNGENYVAYTFYCRNAGEETVNIEYQVYIVNMTLDIEEAVRVRVYVDGESTDYAKTKTDGSGPEPDTTEFLTESIITRKEVTGLAPSEYTKFTIVIWLEGDDPDCTDNLIGGEFKIDMKMSILNAEGEAMDD